MKRFPTLLALAFFVARVAVVAEAAPTPTADPNAPFATLEPSLVKAIHEYDDAQIHGDRTALERLVAPDYLIVRPRGVGDRASLIDGMTHPSSKLQPNTVLKPFTRNYGHTVVTGGWVDLKGEDDGKPFEEKIRFSDVWSKRHGRWFVVMTQLTPSDTP